MIEISVYFVQMSFLNTGERNELSKENQEELLKKALHQQGKCLLIYPQGSHTSLLTALAQTIRTNDETLHQKLCERLEHDLKNFTLPRRLSYIYDDPSIVEDFKKYPELINFVKIILELFSASTERRINVYYMSYSGQITFNLSCKVVNEGGYSEAISIARIDNKYYNIQQREISSKNELSVEDVFKSSPQLDSQELIQTFKPESLLPCEKSQPNDNFVGEETRSSGKPYEDIGEPELLLKRAKSSVPFQHEERSDSIYGIDYQRLGNRMQTMSLREQTQLINQCGPGGQKYEGYHPNMGVMSPEQLYFMYYQNSYYQPKSDNYMNYSNVPMHSMSPSKANSYKLGSSPVQPVPNYYTPTSYPQNGPSPAPDANDNKRYTGRLKFFDDGKNYGFIIMDSDESDIFVHYDDLQKAGITKEVIKALKNQMYLQIRFSFKVMEYFGKYKKSRKAVELVIIEDELSLLTNGYPLPE